jgi:Domain of unknown function (DUF4350)
VSALRTRAPDPTSVAQGLRTRWLSWRWVLLVALTIGLAALIAALSAPHSGDSARLGPDNPAPEGSRALVQVLIRQGVDVQVRRNSRQVVSATDARSTLLVTDPGLLAPEQLDRLAADDAPDLVLVEPDELTLSKLAPRLHSAGQVRAEVREPGCAAPAAQAAGSTRAGGFVYKATSGPSTGLDAATVCYPEAGDPDVGSYLVEHPIGRKITVIGQSGLLTNQYLALNGNATLALSTLGEQPRLVWYTPDPFEPTGARQRPTLTSLLPDWVFWVLVQLVVVIVVAMLWRARRLGRLVPEPLPVVVRAAETQEGRARLYRQARARGRVAATLRTTALRRLAGRLAAPSGTTPVQLVTLVAAATGRDEPPLYELLLGPAPGSDGALIRLADDLDTLQRELTGEPARPTPARST